MCLPVPYAYPDVVSHFNPHPPFCGFTIQRHIWGIIAVPRDSLLPPLLIALGVMDQSRRLT